MPMPSWLDRFRKRRPTKILGQILVQTRANPGEDIHETIRNYGTCIQNLKDLSNHTLIATAPGGPIIAAHSPEIPSLRALHGNTSLLEDKEDPPPPGDRASQSSPIPRGDHSSLLRPQAPPKDRTAVEIQLVYRNENYGTLTVRVRSKARESLELLESLAPVIASEIARHLETSRDNLARALRKTATNLLTQEVPDTKAIVRSIEKALHAESATLFLKDQDMLQVSATTDPGGPGADPRSQSVREALEAARPTRTDEPGDTDEDSIHVLAVPTFSTHPKNPAVPTHTGPTAPVNGVLRIVRRKDPFLKQEEELLKDFAILLGTAVARSWRIHLADRIWRAGTEAVAVSRHRPRSGSALHGDSILVELDQAASRLFGGEDKDLRGRSVREFYSARDYSTLREDLAQALSQGRKSFGPKSIRVRDLQGRFHPTRSSYHFITNMFVSPPVHYTASILRDTRRRQELIDQRYRLVDLLAERGIAYFSADEEGKTTETSPAETKLTYYSKDELKSMYRETLYEQKRERVELFDKVRRKNGSLHHTIQQLQRKDDSALKASGFIRFLNDPLEGPVGYEGIYEDVTDKLKLQELLDLPTNRVIPDDELYESLKENARLNLDVMTSLSHQLTTPLAALTQNLARFKRRLPEGDPLEKPLDFLIGQNKVCVMLARNLSLIDRILKGEPFKKKKTSLGRIVIETKINFSQVYRKAGLNLLIDADSINRNFHTFICSHELFRQVIVNLIDNAIKYSKQGTDISISANQEEGHRRLTISSQGLPVPKRERDLVFGRGFRSPRARSLNEGTGLGLWIVKKIVDLHDGSISCTSVAGEVPGIAEVTFTLSFPL